MRLIDFEKAIQKYAPGIRFRYAGWGDVVGVFHNNDYLFRLNKGELSLLGYTKFPHKKRGRMQALQMLVNMRWLNSLQAQKICWGLE